MRYESIECNTVLSIKILSPAEYLFHQKFIKGKYKSLFLA
ncbi:hypothetical protein RG47T_3036 [Mucilaginibacter polytrichastri]|uniref:Uncharacterized protein n=1 Tax=Mucilaginibacter polytrichastri TaxID=1302689 RepID=A0A1Q6A0N7_9SPHI|nr:hypothetical protein RG47T_3036 [Mucilaginibacter polytrichastri]SFS92353.1 hypothetical protein SAMN04487890_106167 [Mucilaginibacter polytrichastri]